MINKAKSQQINKNFLRCCGGECGALLRSYTADIKIGLGLSLVVVGVVLGMLRAGIIGRCLEI